jgi:CHAT domain-containing protein
MNKGNALQDQGKLEQAVAAYDRAIATFQELVQAGRAELRNDLAGALMNKGIALQDQGKLEQAKVVFAKVHANLFQGDDLRIYHSSLADLMWQTGQKEQALTHLLQARSALREARRTAGVHEAALEYVREREGFIHQAVRYPLEMGRYTTAFEAVQEGKATVLGDLRSRLNGDLEEPEEVRTARRELADWLREGPEPEDTNASAPPESPKTWTTELESRTEAYLRAWRVARHPVLGSQTPAGGPADEPDVLPAVQAALSRGWAVLDFWQTGEREWTAFLVTRDNLSVHHLPLPEEVTPRKLNRELSAWFDLVADPLRALTQAPGTDPALELLNELHAWLFAPLLPALREQNVHGLYLVPHGFLHALPLHAARQGDSDYLCDELAIAYLPSSSLLPQLSALQPGGGLLSLANPERGTRHSLPFSDWEGWQLEQRRGPGRFHRGPHATLARTENWGDASLLHFSCHGLGHPSFAPLSHLRLADDLLLAHDVVYRRPALRDGSVVVLNGCQTAVRDERAFNESMGLMTAFLLRGASLVLATQWSVVDGCAAEMMLTFLDRLLEQGKSPTDALRLAQRQARALHRDDIRHRWSEAQRAMAGEFTEVENGKALAQQALLAQQSGEDAEARDLAGRAAGLLRRAHMNVEADRLLAATRAEAGLVATGPAGRPRACPFDHPIFWSAFQLVGRVT